MKNAEQIIAHEKENQNIFVLYFRETPKKLELKLKFWYIN